MDPVTTTLAHRARSRAWAARQPVDHTGHIRVTRRNGRPHCITCHRGDHDVDEVAVERTVVGSPPDHRLTIAEREAAVTRLAALGFTPTQTATRTGIPRATVNSILQRLKRMNGETEKPLTIR